MFDLIFLPMIKNHGRKGPRGIEPRTQGSKPCVLTITPWSLNLY